MDATFRSNAKRDKVSNVDQNRVIVKVKADSANEVSILNNLDVSSFDYYASYISLDDNNIKVRVKNKTISEDKLEIFDLTNSNIFTMSNKVEYDKDNKPESLYVVYEKVKLKDLDKYDASIEMWTQIV